VVRDREETILTAVSIYCVKVSGKILTAGIPVFVFFKKYNLKIEKTYSEFDLCL
jgi:hypothetical protein